MALTRIHFDTDANIGETIKKKKRVQIQLAYLGSNTYNIKAVDLTNISANSNTDELKVICNKKVTFPAIKSNTRKSFARLRDFALNVVENKPVENKRED